jgi:hypothetical protein
MILQNGAQPGYARHDPFRSAAEPSKKVWLDKSGADPNIRFDQAPIN